MIKITSGYPHQFALVSSDGEKISEPVACKEVFIANIGLSTVWRSIPYEWLGQGVSTGFSLNRRWPRFVYWTEKGYEVKTQELVVRVISELATKLDVSGGSVELIEGTNALLITVNYKLLNTAYGASLLLSLIRYVAENTDYLNNFTLDSLIKRMRKDRESVDGVYVGEAHSRGTLQKYLKGNLFKPKRRGWDDYRYFNVADGIYDYVYDGLLDYMMFGTNYTRKTKKMLIEEASEVGGAY